MSQLGFFHLVVLCLVLADCEGIFFVGFVSNPGGTAMVSGTVSIVHFGFVSDGGGNSIATTAVTFINPGVVGDPATVNFCGDQRNQFPLDQRVRADFNRGAVCSTLIAVAIIS